MTNPTTTVPKLDLAPKLNRPLSLWNPLDYLRLLYWAFFFPQAIRWYVEKFGTIQSHIDSVGWRTLLIVMWHDKIQRNLSIQGLVLNLLGPVVTSAIISKIGLSWIKIDAEYNWGIGAIFGLIFTMTIGVMFIASSGVSEGVAYGVMAGAFISNILVLVMSIATDFMGAMVLSSAFIILYATVYFVPAGIINSMNHIYLRLPASSVFRHHYLQALWFISRMTWTPLPVIQHILAEWANLNWDQTVNNANELYLYTQQYYSVVRALSNALEKMPNQQILSIVSQLACYSDKSIDQYGWTLIGFCSRALQEKDLFPFPGIRVFMPARFEKSITSNLDAKFWIDVPAHAVCTGFWLLHSGEPQAATQAFTKTRSLSNGEELHQIASLLASAQERKDLKTIAVFPDTAQWLLSNLQSPLRPDSLKTLGRLRVVALEAAQANESVSKLNRGAALNRALGELTNLLDDVEQTCPHPEREIVQGIATQWRDILGRAAGEIGQIVVEKPVENPYVTGNPVVGKQFVGRDDILGELEEKWSNTAQPASVVLYGHRRMGKSSILQNLGRYRFGAQTLVAYVNMQRVGRVEHTGELLYDLASELWRVGKGDVTSPLHEPTLDDYQQNWYATFNRFLRELNEQRNGNRFILAIDEFELIEQLIAEGKVERALLDYLRGIIQTEAWLIVVLAGLHTLKEMTSNYFEPLFSSVVPVRVSFLSERALRQVIANPDEDFPLDYDRDALDLIWQLTGGQPYLTQLIGHHLVRAYNAARFEQGHARENKFTVADVQAVVNAPNFFDLGNYYFQGLWQQAEQSQPEHQTDLLRVLAPHPAGLAFHDLLAQTQLDEPTARAALATLQGHDVVAETNGTWRYRVELMRRWVAARLPSS